MTYERSRALSSSGVKPVTIRVSGLQSEFSISLEKS